jgi:hypothetical protein
VDSGVRIHVKKKPSDAIPSHLEMARSSACLEATAERAVIPTRVRAGSELVTRPLYFYGSAFVEPIPYVP